MQKSPQDDNDQDDIIQDPFQEVKKRIKSAGFGAWNVKNISKHYGWYTLFEATDKVLVQVPKEDQTKVPDQNQESSVSVTQKEIIKRYKIQKFDSRELRDQSYARYVLCEMRLLQHFNINPHPNIVTLKEVLSFRGKQESIFVITELLDLTLKDVFISNHPLVEAQMAYIFYRVLSGVRFMHKANVTHGAIKPDCILLDYHLNPKIIDFGLESSATGVEISKYVSSLNYCAPEVVLDSPNCTNKIDVWSVGCILGQMCNKIQGPNGGPYQLLFPGSTRPVQLQSIINFVGSRSEEDINLVGTQYSRDFIRRTFRDIQPKEIRTILRTPDGKPIQEPLAQLIEGMLIFNPKKRITIEEAMQYPWVKPSCVDPSDSEIPTLFSDPVIDPNESQPQNILHEVAREIHSGLNQAPMVTFAFATATATATETTTAVATAHAKPSKPSEHSVPTRHLQSLSRPSKNHYSCCIS